VRISIFILFLVFSVNNYIFSENISNSIFISNTFDVFLNNQATINDFNSYEKIYVNINNFREKPILKERIKIKFKNVIFFDEIISDSLLSPGNVDLSNNSNELSNYAEIFFNIDSIKLKFISDENNSNKIIRSINLKINYDFINHKSNINNKKLNTISLKDTISTDYFDSIKINASQSGSIKTEEKSFFEKVFQPALLFTTSLAIILLLFFVRS
jgi:hypothetical protein